LRLPKELSGGILLTANTVLILCLAFPVQVMVARYLGPSELGIYAYVLSFWAIARVLVSLNLQDVIIPLVKERSDEHYYRNGWLLSKTASVLLVPVAFVGLLASYLQQDVEAARRAAQILLVVGATLFMDHEIYSIWCKCEGQLWDFVKIDLGGAMIGIGARLLVIYQLGSIELLLGTYVLEQVAKLVIALTLYRTGDRTFFGAGRWSGRACSVLLSKAWPIWLSALLTICYAKFDQILLGNLLDQTDQLGYYSVAARLVEALTAGAVAMFIIYLPILSHEQGERFRLHHQRLHDITVWGSVLIVVPLSFILESLVVWLYGERFSEAGRLVTFYLAGLPAVSLGLSRSAFMYARGLQKLELFLKSVAVATNIGLNLYLIPRYGAMGAVWATVGVQWFFSVLVNPFFVSLRPVSVAMLRAAILPMSLLRLIAWVRKGQPEESSIVD
jgi:O-antigen/teichoic acid export membrane protein